MTRRLAALVALVCSVAGASSVSRAWAQGLPAPGPGGSPPPTGEGSVLVVPVLILTVALLGVLILAVAVMDLRRKRRAEAVAIEGQISDALMREPRLAGAVVTAMAQVPLTARSAPTVEIRGEVEYPELREIAVRIVRQELLRYHQEGRVEDRIFVSPPVLTSRH